MSFLSPRTYAMSDEDGSRRGYKWNRRFLGCLALYVEM